MKGKRIQVYLAADLVEKWEATPRYERSAEVAEALRKHWGMKKLPTKLPTKEKSGEVSNDTSPHQDAGARDRA